MKRTSCLTLELLCFFNIVISLSRHYDATQQGERDRGVDVRQHDHQVVVHGRGQDAEQPRLRLQPRRAPVELVPAGVLRRLRRPAGVPPRR